MPISSISETTTACVPPSLPILPPLTAAFLSSLPASHHTVLLLTVRSYGWWRVNWQSYSRGQDKAVTSWPERMRWIHLLPVWRKLPKLQRWERWGGGFCCPLAPGPLITSTISVTRPSESRGGKERGEEWAEEKGEGGVGECVWVNINECVPFPFIPQGLILDDVLKSRPQFITLNRSQCLCCGKETAQHCKNIHTNVFSCLLIVL